MLDILVVIEGLEIAFVVEDEEGVFLTLDVVDKEGAIQVIDFVLEDASESISGFDADVGAVFEDGFDSSFGIAGDEAIDGGDGETTLVVGFWLAFVFDNFRVDEGDEIRVFLVVHIFADDDNAFVIAELGGGHSGGEFEFVLFFPIFGGFAHFGDDGFNFRGNLSDFGGLFAEFGVGSGDDFHKCNYSIRWCIREERGGRGGFGGRDLV